MLVILLTLSAMAKNSDLKFLFPLQSLAAVWTAHMFSGLLPERSEWRPALDVALMLSAFLWARRNIKREDKISDAAHNLIFPAAVLLALYASGLFADSALLTLAAGLPAIVYIALTATERREPYRLCFAALGAIFALFAYYNIAESAFPLAFIGGFHIVFAAFIAVVAFVRIPKFESGADVRRASAFAVCCVILLELQSNLSIWEWNCGLWQAGFIALAAAIALADSISSTNKYRRCGGGMAAYALSLWLIDAMLSYFGNSGENALPVLDDLRPVALLAVATAVLAAESLIFNKEGKPTRAAFVAAVLAYSVCVVGLLASQNSLFGYSGDPMYYVASIVFGGVGSYVIYRRERTHADVFAALALYAGLRIFAGEIFPSGELPELGAVCFALALCAAFANVLGYDRRGYSNSRAVWALACFELFNFWIPHRHLIALGGGLLLSMNLLQYLRVRGGDTRDKVLISAAFAVFAAVLWQQAPYICSSYFDVFTLEPFALIIVGGAFLTARLLWKMNTPSHWACFAVSLFCAAWLYAGAGAADGAYRLAHIAFVTACALASLTISLFIKRGRWFVFGFGATLFIFVRETAAFWLSVKWWVYLLAVGLALVAIAAVNESERRRGTTLVDRLKNGRIKEWQW
jgi:hypothetical protein